MKRCWEEQDWYNLWARQHGQETSVQEVWRAKTSKMYHEVHLVYWEEQMIAVIAYDLLLWCHHQRLVDWHHEEKKSAVKWGFCLPGPLVITTPKPPKSVVPCSFASHAGEPIHWDLQGSHWGYMELVKNHGSIPIQWANSKTSSAGPNQWAPQFVSGPKSASAPMPKLWASGMVGSPTKTVGMEPIHPEPQTTSRSHLGS